MFNKVQIIFVFVLASACVSFAKEKKSQEPMAWKRSMQTLAKSLQDGYPFLYSHREFRSPKNKEYILRTLNQFINSAHQLPREVGRQYVGAAPLADEAKSSFKDFSQVRSLYERKKYDLAQKKVHGLIQNCFACHTAYHVGPSFSNRKSEITGIATPFPRSKVVVFGALREFKSALKWIERESVKKKTTLPLMDLAKLHLVVSLRSMQDFERARSYLIKLAKKFNDSKDKLATIQRWQNDLAMWEANSKADNKTESQDMNYVLYLRETLEKHSQIQSKKTVSELRAQTFYELGHLYKNLKLKELSQLPKVYFKACLKAQPKADLKKRCSQELK